MASPEFSPARVPRSLPRGRSSLPREVVLVSQRERLLEAVVVAVAREGYAATTIADVIGLAGVSRTTFYEHFRDKEDCFIAAYEQSAGVHFDHIAAAATGQDSLIDGFRAGVRRYLELLAAEPAYAVTFLVEVLAAGPAAARRREAIHDLHVEYVMKWHRRLRAKRRELPTPPREVFEATTGGVNDLVARWVRAGRTAELGQLEDAIVAVWFSVAGLHEEAADLYQRARRRRTRRAAG